ncbi:MAG: HEAT repeat domain-containing protein [Phycisphaerales bacterium]|nr:MAG: HEAT repeat domain-containing protein [Phycisphaerales bacterium]
MLRKFVWTTLASLVGLSAPFARSQITEGPPDQATRDQLAQLQNIREGIVDPDARPEDRRRWVELLLSYNSTHARTLVVELLGLAEQAEVQGALCRVIAERAREAPERLDAAFVGPLVDLLGAEAGDLRATAGEALAEFPGADVPARLGALAAQADAPLTKRLAAIDALAPNTHRREVVGQLINLLDVGAPEITERAVNALESATPATFGPDLERWRQWWEQKSRLSEEAWLAEQLQIYRDRSRRVAEEFQTFRESSRREHSAITARTRSYQRELFRAVNGDHRDAKLAEWLDDPLPVVKFTALSIIKAGIADEGKRPEGQVLVALLGLLAGETPQMRCEVLDIIQNLNDPAVVDAVLARLTQERDPTTRHAIFRALGKLDSPVAIPALIGEIANPESLPDCVREAAIALGQVAARSPEEETLQNAVAALKTRYRMEAEKGPAMRAALLTAMAGVADGAFRPEFLEAVESDKATILGAAIRGVLAISDTSKLPRLRTLMAHSDLLVRLAATEAVGELGREEADVESLLTRLNPTIEANELAREAAWRGFCRLLGNRPVRDRIEAARRLRNQPDLELRYLEQLADTLSTVNGETAYLEIVLDRLATALIAQARYQEAVGHLRALFDMQCTRSDPEALACGLRLLEAVLRSPAELQVAALVQQLAATAGDDTDKAAIIETVAEYLASPELATDKERARTLLADLSSVPADTLGEAWTRLLKQAARRLESSDANMGPSPPVPGN